MEFVVVTGLSGAGKTRALGALEDIGFFCVDNIPPSLIPKFAELSLQSKGEIKRIAVITDLRGGSLFDGLFDSLQEVAKLGISYKLLYLEASDAVLLKRYRETRRRHPLAETATPALEKVIADERRHLQPARERADYIIDTSQLSPAQLKERLTRLFSGSGGSALLVSVMSFGFKFGAPSEADLVFDLRCMPNPFYEPSMRDRTGLDQSVRDYVLQWPQAQGLLPLLRGLLEYLLPLYSEEGKSQLVVAFGCTGGHHRSVVFAELFGQQLSRMGYHTTVYHRDIDTPV